MLVDGAGREMTSLVSELLRANWDEMSISSTAGEIRSPFLNLSNSLIKIVAFEDFISPISLPRTIRFAMLIIVSELGLLTR